MFVLTASHIAGNDTSQALQTVVILRSRVLEIYISKKKAYYKYFIYV